MPKDSILISEIFGPTLQGEGAMIGKPTLFVRTGGCDFRCSWCDTPYAVDSEYRHNWQKMDSAEILKKCCELIEPPYLITLSGGNPAIQPLEKLIDDGKKMGFSFSMETQGSIAKEWFNKLDHLVLSPKPPSSKTQFDERELGKCVAAAPKFTIFKVVIFNEADFLWARELSKKFTHFSWYLQPGNPNIVDKADTEYLANRLDWLARLSAQYDWRDVTILPQLHVLIWNNERGR